MDDSRNAGSNQWSKDSSSSSERDTRRDGLRNKLEAWALTHLSPAWWIVNSIEPLSQRVSALLVDNAVRKTRSRPHPFSTMSTYTSWPSLTDRSWNARHVAETSQDSLPPVEDVAALFQRPESGMQASPKSTNLFPVFAQWFTDGFLRTMDSDRRRNTSTHQIDLSQLYGATEQQATAVRLMSTTPGERGKLKSQYILGEEYSPFLFEADGVSVKPEFSTLPKPVRLVDSWPVEKRRTIFAFGGDRANTTPQTAMLNILFLREHNRLCGEIERRHPHWDDERIFQTSRNICIAMLIKVVVEEYINHIAPYHFKFRGNPSVAWTAQWNKPNWIAVEFNLLYRWHSLVPDKIAWGDKVYMAQNMALDNTPLLDIGLAAAFDATSRQPAGHMSMFNTPTFLMDAEARSIHQGRTNGLASYNDYREAMSYPRITEFEQISSRRDVVDGLRRLYKTPDKIEFYAGIFAEDTRVNGTVPPLIGRMVGVDAFSHALTNPLLSEHVFNANTFSPHGLQTILDTTSLCDIVKRNVAGGSLRVSMTLESWVRQS